jgi:SAM-dependent methyltransferase
MDHREAGRCWERNCECWTRLVREGYDVYRDHVNTPAFMALLPDVAGLHGLDLGCGEGNNTRLVAEGAASLVALDIVPGFCETVARTHALPVVNASGLQLPFAGESFDFCTAFMSIMDMPEQDVVLREVHRVLRPGGFLQFSMTHPCFSTKRRKWVHDEEGNRIGVVCGDYFDPPQGWVEEWIFGAIPAEQREGLPRFQVPRFDHTLSWWLNTFVATGFQTAQCVEPTASDAAIEACPSVADERIVPNFIIFQLRKPRWVPQVGRTSLRNHLVTHHTRHGGGLT